MCYDFPVYMQQWNLYRNRALGYWLQSNGIEVIPNVRWSDERSLEFAFEGLPKRSTVAISTYGCIQKKYDRDNFKKGLEKMVVELKPETIVNYSRTPDDIFLPYKQMGINIISFDSYLDCLYKARARHG